MAHLFVEINGFFSLNFDFRYICHIVVMDATQASAFCLRIKKKSMKGKQRTWELLGANNKNNILGVPLYKRRLTKRKIITEESKTYKTLGSTEAVLRDYPFSALNPVPEHINNLRSSFAVVRDVLGSYT